MALKTRKNEPFTTIIKDASISGDNIVFIKGGSTIISDQWIHFNDLRINVANLIQQWASTATTRIFNKKNGILYVLITLNKNQKLEIVPSISLNKTNTGKVTKFNNLSGKLPLVLVKLEQDGTNDLSSYKTIKKSMLEIYKGYGNFTLKGESGLTGPPGNKGVKGLDGAQGVKGEQGATGLKGYGGIQGEQGVAGDSGVSGSEGVQIPRRVLSLQVPPSADFVGSPLKGAPPLSVQFTNLSLGSWTYIYWDFGDGTSSTEEDPLHVYTTIGTYTVSLYLKMIDWEDKEIKYDYVVVSGCAVQDVVDQNNPSGGWQGTINDSEDTIQNTVSEDCS